MSQAGFWLWGALVRHDFGVLTLDNKRISVRVLGIPWMYRKKNCNLSAVVLESNDKHRSTRQG